MSRTPPPLASDGDPMDIGAPVRRGPNGFRVALIVGIVAVFAVPFAILMVLGLCIELGVFPDSAAVPGGSVPGHVSTMLEAEGLLELDEKIIFFYSGGLFSYREDGNYFTDRRVVSYQEAEDGTLEVESATYDEIRNIDVEYSSGLLEDSLITVTTDETTFILICCNENGRDRDFYQALVARWKGKSADKK